MAATQKLRRTAAVQDSCVACGCCVKVCPRDAIHILYGIRAVVDGMRCIGCGRCAKECPASVITMQEVAR